MKSLSRIRFNPTTKEIEVGGSESFVKTYFDKLQAMLSSIKGKAAIQQQSKKTAKAKKASPEPKRKSAARKTRGTRVTHIDKVVTAIQAAPEGISTPELKKMTGLDENQIWNIVNRAAKKGKIKKVKKGLYVGISSQIGK